MAFARFQCFHCLKSDNVHESRFSAFNVVLVGKRVLTQGDACFSVR